MSEKVRVQYSGFIIFASQFIGVATGLIFTLLLTRPMSTAEYGVWTNIFDYATYFALFSGLLPFWATRFVARNKEGTVKSSTLAQLVIGLVSTAIYLPAIFLIYVFAIAPKIAATMPGVAPMSYLPYFLIAGLYILASYLIAILESNLKSIKPQALGYGFLIEEFVKVGVGLVLILGFKQLFLGAMSALILSYFAQTAYYLSLLKPEFRQKTNWSYLKQWIKGSAVLAYNSLGSQLGNFVFILLFFFGGPSTRADYQAALSFTVVIGYSLSLSTALYPRLLSDSCSSEHVRTSFRTVMMLAIPLTALTFVMPVSFLTILNGAYADAWPVLIALSINTLMTVIYSFYSTCICGVEAFDAGGQISIRGFVKTKIFKVFTLQYIEAAIALPVAYIVLTKLPLAGSVWAAVYVIAILFAVQALTFAAIYIDMHHSISIPVAWASIAKYILAAALMSVILYLTPTTTTLLWTIAKAIVGFGIYVAVLLVIDVQARQLVRLVWTEIRGSIKQLISKEEVD